MTDFLEELRRHTGLRLARQDVLLLRNVGSRVARAGLPEDHIANRGFNLALLSPDRQPRFYVKCRLATSMRARREAVILQCLGGDPKLSNHVPTAAIYEACGLQIIVMDFLPGSDLADFLSGASDASRIARINEALDLAEAAAGVAVRAGVLQDKVKYRPVAGEIVTALSKLGDGTGLERFAERIVEAISEVWSIPQVVQHGDLTARNIRLSRNRLMLIDFEAFGEISGPLFDAWNMARNATHASGWSQGKKPWWLGPAAQIVAGRARRLELEANHIQCTLIWYLATMAFVLWNRGVPRSYFQPYLAELTAVLEQGAS
jgi:tRNA A-37 threonylcarbamoyl transferase component Bud32